MGSNPSLNARVHDSDSDRIDDNVLPQKIDEPSNGQILTLDQNSASSDLDINENHFLDKISKGYQTTHSPIRILGVR